MPKIITRKGKAIDEWIYKEWGSYEDHKHSPAHVVPLLERFGGNTHYTNDELKTLIISGEYQSTAWQPDEIDGGQVTIDTIARYVKKFKEALTQQ